MQSTLKRARHLMDALLEVQDQDQLIVVDEDEIPYSEVVIRECLS